MAKTPSSPKKPGDKSPKSKAPNSKASRPDVQPIGPALAELLNPAINRGESGLGSTTGLQPPPDNSWDRRAGGEAAAHRARKSTAKNFPLDAAASHPMPLRQNPQPPGARKAKDKIAEPHSASSPPASSLPPPLPRTPQGGRENRQGLSE